MREESFLLAAPEKRFLRWLAAKLPKRVLPDDMTAVGVLAAIAIAVAYQLSNDATGWLWVASALLVVQWIGDSLDGTLARVRGIERPTYGYYLDHLVDAFSTAVIGIGLGLSPFMLLSTGTLIVVAYLILSINVYLESFAFNRFSIGYRQDRTDRDQADPDRVQHRARVAPRPRLQPVGLDLTVFDVVGLGIAATMVVLLAAGRFATSGSWREGAGGTASLTVS